MSLSIQWNISNIKYRYIFINTTRFFNIAFIFYIKLAKTLYIASAWHDEAREN